MLIQLSLLWTWVASMFWLLCWLLWVMLLQVGVYKYLFETLLFFWSLCEASVLWQGIKSRPLQWKPGILITSPLGNSQDSAFGSFGIYPEVYTRMDMSLSKLQEILKDRGAWWTAVYGVAELDGTKKLNNSKFISSVCLSLIILSFLCLLSLLRANSSHLGYIDKIIVILTFFNQPK